MLWLLVVGLLWLPSNAWATPPDPETFAAYLHSSIFAAMLQAFAYGVGLGLLVKMVNRS